MSVLKFCLYYNIYHVILSLDVMFHLCYSLALCSSVTIYITLLDGRNHVTLTLILMFYISIIKMLQYFILEITLHLHQFLHFTSVLYYVLCYFIGRSKLCKEMTQDPLWQATSRSFLKCS